MPPFSLLSSLSPLSVFTDIQSGFADALDSSFETAGFLLGLIVVVLILIVSAWALGQDFRVTMIAGVSGVIFAILIGWWPTWTAILVVIVLAVLLFRMPGLGGGTD